MRRLDLTLGEYELEEPWGRLAEVARRRERAAIDDEDADRGLAAVSDIRTFVLKDRTTRSSSLSCKSVEDAVSLTRFLDAHLAELRRYLLDRGDNARLRSLDADAHGAVCRVTWSFTTGDADPSAATAANVKALHRGFLVELSPVELVGARLTPRLAGGKAVLAVCTLDCEPAALPKDGRRLRWRPLDGGVELSLRLDLQAPSGPGYRDVQVAAAAALARSAGAAVAQR